MQEWQRLNLCQSRRSRNNRLTGFFPSKQPYCRLNKSPAGSGCTSTQLIQPRMEMNMCALLCKQFEYCISCLSGLSTTESKYPGLKVAAVGETTLSCGSDCDDVWFCPQHTNTVICRRKNLSVKGCQGSDNATLPNSLSEMIYE